MVFWLTKEELEKFEEEVIGREVNIDIKKVNVNDIIPYDKNPRNNDGAVDLVLKSIKEFGLKQPIVLDKNNVIVVGHTRYKALVKLGVKEIPVIYATDLSDEQIKAYRIMDNKSNEFAFWDNDLLKVELESLKAVGYDLDLTGFSLSDRDFMSEADELLHSYTEKIVIPNYVPTLTKPDLSLLYDDSKYKELVKKIEASTVSKEVKEFLKLAATRHIVFNYRNIANYYAHSGADVQELFEDSVLVIIDFNKAIEKGYVDFMREIFDSGEFYNEG